MFLKDPRRAEVKSRLAEEVGRSTARTLYRHMVQELMGALRKMQGFALWVAVWPPQGLGDVAQWLGPGPRYIAQRGLDLGQRMAQAMGEAFREGFARALVVGSDVPEVVGQLPWALRALQEAPVVLGPALDGGYYLIGFRRRGFLPQVFEAMPWGGHEVLAETLRRLRLHGLEPALLRPLRDLDTLQDLLALQGPEAERLRGLLRP